MEFNGDEGDVEGARNKVGMVIIDQLVMMIKAVSGIQKYMFLMV